MRIRGIKIEQGNHGFILQKIKVRDLYKFTRFTERILMGLDDDNKPIYNDYFQRKLDTSKVNKIADYLTYDPDSIFPTNIVLAVPQETITEIMPEEGQIDWRENEMVFDIKQFVLDELSRNVYITIVDGQHRIRGIEVALAFLNQQIDTLFPIIEHSTNAKLKQQYEQFVQAKTKLMDFELIVAFILDATIDYQASIFSTINRTQTKVSENLVQSLFGITDKESPQKTALEITLALNSFPSSPFFKRIKLFGHDRNIVEGVPVITQSSFVKSIVKLISQNPREAERDRFRSRKDLIQGITPELCFRRYYARNEDQKIINILFAYFKAASRVFTAPNGLSFWSLDNQVPRNLLQTSVGFMGLLFFLPQLLSIIAEDQKELPESYEAFLQRAAHLDLTDFNTYPLASITKNRLIADLTASIFPG